MPRYVMDFERPLFELRHKLEELRHLDLAGHPDLASEIDALEAQLELLEVETYEHLSAWDRVQVSRHPDRPKTDDYLAALFTDVVEVHGDRAFGDDEAMFAGFGTLHGRRVAVLGHRKGHNTKENLRYNFGQPHPEGFRKGVRLMRLAEKAGLPLVTFLDTAGAHPGIEAEERGQAIAIAESLALLSGLRVPVVVVGVGEGGSGGALAIGFGDHVIMLENAYYSVISPEACASILVKDSGRANEVASCLRMTAADLVDLTLADEVIPEPLGGAHRDPGAVLAAVEAAVVAALDALATRDIDELVTSRYERLRAIGHVVENRAGA